MEFLNFSATLYSKEAERIEALKTFCLEKSSRLKNGEKGVSFGWREDKEREVLMEIKP